MYLLVPFSSMATKPTNPLGIEGLMDRIAERKQEIRDRFKKYHETLHQTEVMLLADLDGILARGETEKRDTERQIREVESAKEFMLKQLESSINESLTNSVYTLTEEIKKLKGYVDEVPVISLSWKFDNFLHLIHQICYIEEKSFPLARSIAWSKLGIGDRKSRLQYCSDFCYDETERRYYFINSNEYYYYHSYNIPVYSLELQFMQSYSLDIPLKNCHIKTNSEFIFLSFPNEIIQLIKSSSENLTSKKVLKIELNAKSSRIEIYGDFIYTTSNTNVVYKLSVNDLEIVEEIHLRNDKEENNKFNGIFDLKATETELYVLFNFSTQRAVHCFDLTGSFKREIVSNGRGLQHPLSFCLGTEGTVYVADGQVKAFDKYGRQVDAFGKQVADNTAWAECVTFYSNSNQVLVLAELDGKWLHVYTQPNIRNRKQIRSV